MLRPERNHEIPELTRFVAREALPNGSIFMTLRDELGPIFEDEDFADLYPSLGTTSGKSGPSGSGCFCISPKKVYSGVIQSSMVNPKN